MQGGPRPLTDNALQCTHNHTHNALKCTHSHTHAHSHVHNMHSHIYIYIYSRPETGRGGLAGSYSPYISAVLLFVHLLKCEHTTNFQVSSSYLSRIILFVFFFSFFLLLFFSFLFFSFFIERHCSDSANFMISILLLTKDMPV